MFMVVSPRIVSRVVWSVSWWLVSLAAVVVSRWVVVGSMLVAWLFSLVDLIGVVSGRFSSGYVCFSSFYMCFVVAQFGSSLLL